MFRKRIRISNIKDPDQSFEEEFWVDTEALYSFVPEDCLEKIGVEPSVTRNLVLVDGRQDHRLVYDLYGLTDDEIAIVEGLDNT